MAILRVGIRAGETENWSLIRQRETLAGNPGRVRAGDDPSALQSLVALRGANLTERIGVVFKRIEGGSFIYQRQRAQIETFEAAETPFTIGMMKKLLFLKGKEVREIFKDKDWSVDVVIEKSLAVAAKDIPEAEKDSCPLVYASKYESEAIARLLETDILTERQWERTASGTDGRMRPWGDDIDQSRAVYNDSGTRPVKSKPAGVSAEGLYDLIGNVQEWTKEAVLRGSSWPDGKARCGAFDLRAAYRSYCPPEDRSLDIGFRLARNLKG